jgi:hypothetical protein
MPTLRQLSLMCGTDLRPVILCDEPSGRLPGAWENGWDNVSLNNLSVGLQHFLDHLLSVLEFLTSQFPFFEGNCILGLFLFPSGTPTPSHVILPARTIMTLVSFPNVADRTVIVTILRAVTTV